VVYLFVFPYLTSATVALKACKWHICIRHGYFLTGYVGGLSVFMRLVFEIHLVFIKNKKEIIMKRQNASQMTLTVSVKFSSMPDKFSPGALFIPFTCWLPGATA
jgi:hypothetical protein